MSINKNKNTLNNLIRNNNNHKYNEHSNGIIKNKDDNIKRPSSLKEKEKQYKEDFINKETKNHIQNNIPQLKKNDIFRKNMNKKESEPDIKNNELISNENQEKDNENKKQKKIIIEIINTDKPINKKTQKEEIIGKGDNDHLNNISKNSEKSQNFTNISRNTLNKYIKEKSKNNMTHEKEKKNNNIYYQSKDLLKNDNKEVQLKIEDDKMSKKELISEEHPFVEDNYNYFIASPFHNNAK